MFVLLYLCFWSSVLFNFGVGQDFGFKNVESVHRHRKKNVDYFDDGRFYFFNDNPLLPYLFPPIQPLNTNNFQVGIPQFPLFEPATIYTKTNFEVTTTPINTGRDPEKFGGLHTNADKEVIKIQNGTKIDEKLDIVVKDEVEDLDMTTAASEIGVEPIKDEKRFRVNNDE